MNKILLSRFILMSYTLLFAIVTTVTWSRSEEFWIDGLTSVIACLFLFFLHCKYDFPPFIAFLAGFIFIPHLVGYAFLYNLALFQYHGDWIVHFVASFIGSIVALYFLRVRLLTEQRLWVPFFLAFALVITGGTMVEIIEYWGFIFYGFGESYLGFGAGDNSQNFGPWENACLDMTFNVAGVLAGLALYGWRLAFSHRGQ